MRITNDYFLELELEKRLNQILQIQFLTNCHFDSSLVIYCAEARE